MIDCVSETSKCRDRLIKYCEVNGLDLGAGGDPIKENSITVDLENPYSNVGSKEPNLKGDARDLYWFKDECLDYVFSSHLLEDFIDTEPVLKEWLRVLKKGGKLIIFCPDEQKYREHCRNTGQIYNENHKLENFGLNYVKEILEKLENIKIIHETSLINIYSFEIVIQKI